MAEITWDAGEYKKHSSAQFGWAMELMEKLHLSGNETVLDIGCGDGKVTAGIALQVPGGSVVGIDSSPQMIALAHDAFKLPNVRFEVMDAQELQFESAFDVVFSNAVLHWVDDHPAVLRGIKRSLTRGGRVLLQMGGRGNADGMRKVFDEVISRETWRSYFAGFKPSYNFLGPDEYRRWGSEAGLQINRAALIPKDMVHAGKQGLAGWVRTTWMAYTKHVPEDLREALIKEVIEAYLTLHPLDTDGNSHVAMVRLEVEGSNP